MHHFFEAITNTAGDSLIGYFARVIDRTTQNTVTLSSDDNGTPIVTVSGVENMAKSDAYGNLSLYVTPGTYHLDIYAPNTTSFLYRVSDVAMNSTKGDKGDAGDQGESGPAGEGLDEVMAPAGSGLVGYGARSVQSKLDEVNSVRDTKFSGGAKGDGVTDDTAAIQAALNFVASNGGGTVWFPAGNYKTTATLNLPGTVSIDGQGQFSRIIANLCNGITILASDVIGPRRIANIWLQGNGGDNFSAIDVALDFPLRATGMVIECCYMSFFGTGINAKGLWHSTIRTNTINQVHRGIVLYNRNVKVTVDDNRVTKGTLVSGTGPSVGVQVGDDAAGLRPEDIQVQRNIFVDFARGCYWRQGLFGGVTHNDFDYCTEAGILFVTADGGTAFSDNWIQVDNTTADVYGIRGTALGTVPGVDNIEIHNNRMRATDVQIIAGQFHSFGMDFGDKQANLSVDGNSVQGAFQVGVRCDGLQRSSFRNNKAVGQIFLFNLNGVLLNGNTWLGGITLSGNVNMAFGKDFGLHTTEIVGSVEIPAGATTATASFLSLNMPDLPLGGYSTSCVLSDRGTLTHGGLAATTTRTGITVTCQNAFGVVSSVDFHLRIY